jgi:hypothetical protein
MKLQGLIALLPTASSAAIGVLGNLFLSDVIFQRPYILYRASTNGRSFSWW